MYPQRNLDNEGDSFAARRGYVPDALTVDSVLAVARYGGMNRAAEHLNVSQQTVSMRIAKLEKHLDVMSRDVVLAPARNDTVPIQEVSVQTACH